MIGKLLGKQIKMHYDIYLSEGSTQDEKDRSLADLSPLAERCEKLGVAAFPPLFADSNLSTVFDQLNLLEPDDPLRVIHNRLVTRYIEVYATASVSERLLAIPNFSEIAIPMIRAWSISGRHDQVAEFWTNSFGEIDFKEIDRSGELNKFIDLCSTTVSSLVQIGKRKEGETILNEALALCDTSLEERPWDWYSKESYCNLCFNSAATFKKIGEPESTKPLLHRAWSVRLRQYGKEQLLNKYQDLPLKGEVPTGASEEDREFFSRFSSGEGRTAKNAISRFTIPCDFSGTPYPFFVYVISGPRGYTELQDQFRWLKEFRGGEVPKEIRDSFLRLNNIASENNVDFRELCVYALGEANTPFK